ncbi:SET domain-containing protein SmydA-8 isoform X1 [Drosophila pseudoobscura]|uniref:SET domain-containing protein SmydA-8 isoform X1 n=1 Tax=Drosophila pseudoobscura pseudoobscura TaxID=46245 RepID=A0A6I8UYI5_DROPS|nr:SET domain-containing protein SmydA-8 isoform X1 [Drosophila pseudoobscura]
MSDHPEYPEHPGQPAVQLLSRQPQQMAISASTRELAELIDLHLGELRPKEPAWRVSDSPISGRGIFATREIAKGEELFREHTILVGPTAHRSSNLRTCTLCYRLVPGQTDAEALCLAGCGLPVCGECGKSPRHKTECDLFLKWKPKVTERIDPRSLRILSVVRCFFLDEQQRRLLYAMQANADRYYMKEVERAAACFEDFPREQEMLDFFYRTICAFNTNAFESRSCVEGHEVLIRALFPLAGLLNHQCTPNAGHHFQDGETIIVCATERIACGAEITVSYAKMLWSTLARKIFLGMTKGFMCQCPRCQDPTENGTYLSALFCREQGCRGLVIPVQTRTLQPDWRCLSCENVFPHSKMARYQDFALNTINNRINSCSVPDMIHFINDLCPRFCPPSNYVLIEAKLNVIWRMTRFDTDQYTTEEVAHKDRYREDILAILHKLGAGECTLKKLITEEIQ